MADVYAFTRIKTDKGAFEVGDKVTGLDKETMAQLLQAGALSRYNRLDTAEELTLDDVVGDEEADEETGEALIGEKPATSPKTASK